MGVNNPPSPIIFGVTAAQDLQNGLTIPGATSGSVTITSGSAPGTQTLILPQTPGSNGQALTTNGAGALSWVTPTGVGAPNYRYAGYYPSSTSNYWSYSTTGSTFSNFAPSGTIPSPTIIYNTGFTAPTVTTGSLPGVTFTAPVSGTIEFQVALLLNQAGGNTGMSLQLYEISTPKQIGVASNLDNGNANWVVLSGFLDVTASTNYTVVAQIALANGGTAFIGDTSFLTAAAPCLQFQMKYVH